LIPRQSTYDGIIVGTIVGGGLGIVEGAGLGSVEGAGVGDGVGAPEGCGDGADDVGVGVWGGGGEHDWTRYDGRSGDSPVPASGPT
jgi:hypothetical protein